MTYKPDATLERAAAYNHNPQLPDENRLALASLVRGFQRSHGLDPDGKAGPQTTLAIASTNAADHDFMVQAIDYAFGMQGKPYKFGHEVSLDDPEPAAFDCSELVQWAVHRAGGFMPDGSWIQATYCRDSGTLVSPKSAVSTFGALLFWFDSSPFEGQRPSQAHVAFSLGDGTTLEARPKHGVGVFAADRMTWTHGGLVPRL